MKELHFRESKGICCQTDPQRCDRTEQKSPQERLRVWIGSACGGDDALKLYQDLLWTVWWRQRESGLYKARITEPLRTTLRHTHV